MYFRNYRPRKTCLDKCLKVPVSQREPVDRRHGKWAEALIQS